jgi:hypothetical protein
MTVGSGGRSYVKEWSALFVLIAEGPGKSPGLFVCANAFAKTTRVRHKNTARLLRHVLRFFKDRRPRFFHHVAHVFVAHRALLERALG